MKSIVFLFFLVSGLLFAAEKTEPVAASKAEFVYPDFTQCYEKNKASIVYFGTTRAIAISEKHAIAYTKEKPSYPYLRHDYLSNLYLFESSKPLTPVTLKATDEMKLGEWLASMDERSLHVGIASKKATPEDAFFYFGGKGEPSSLVGGLCCEMYGLGIGEDRFIGSEALKRFIEGKDATYPDLGARFIENNESIVVDAIDPVAGKTKLRVGDKITQLNGKVVKTLAQFHEAFMLGKKEEKLSAKIERNEKWVEENILILPPKPKVVKKVAPPKKESYLQKKGFELDKDLRVSKLSYGSLGQKLGLHIGDRLIQVDGMDVKTLVQADAYLSKTKKREVDLLFDRDDFQFFVTLKR